jgi:ATP-dependent Clp protease ATP-binding subunit ClpA
MAAGVLKSPRAIELSIYVVRVFVAMRELATTHEELIRRLDELERKIGKRLAGQDHTISEILSAIRSLMQAPPSKGRPIGFITPGES